MLMSRRGHNGNLRCGQTFGRSPQHDFAGLAGFRADNHQTKSVVSFALVRLERFETCRIAVVGRHDFARSVDVKVDLVMRTRHEQAALVRHGHGDK